MKFSIFRFLAFKSTQISRAFRVLLILLIFSLLVTGCRRNITNQNNISKGLENGFNLASSSEPMPTLFCAYKSDTTKFDIDNVTLDFYYGGYYYQGVQFELENTYDFPSFELYFTNDNGEKFFIQRVEENFVSEKYSCDIVRDKKGHFSEIIFKHTESITIPKEIFTEEHGVIYFAIYSANVKEINPTVKCITGTYIYYKMVDGKIVLSNQRLN